MFEGNRRQVIAAGILTVCLLLVGLPGSTQASTLERGEPSQVGLWLDEGFSFWLKLWQEIESLWARQSVLIVPDLTSPDPEEDPEEDP